MTSNSDAYNLMAAGYGTDTLSESHDAESALFQALEMQQ